MASNKLNGKIALVTGAGRGIGRATALELARQGAKVVVVARSRTELEETAAQVQAIGGAAFVYTVDLTDSQATLALVPQIEREVGVVSILINNAGAAGPYGKTWTLDTAQWEQGLHVNLVAPFLLAHQTLPQMVSQNWGRIVSVSALASQYPQLPLGVYAASKAGLETLTRQLSFELAGTNIAVTAIYPGLVETALSIAARTQQADFTTQANKLLNPTTGQEQVLPVEVPARLITAIVLTEDTSLSGQIVNIRSEQGQALVNSISPA